MREMTHYYQPRCIAKIHVREEDRLFDVFIALEFECFDTTFTFFSLFAPSTSATTMGIFYLSLWEEKPQSRGDALTGFPP